VSDEKIGFFLIDMIFFVDGFAHAAKLEDVDGIKLTTNNSSWEDRDGKKENSKKSSEKNNKESCS
jgi:hypothetical protein